MRKSIAPFVSPSLREFKWHLENRGRPSGTALLWLHGFMGSTEDWIPLVDSHFSGYSNILIDLPGHGSSTLSHLDDSIRLLETLVTQLHHLGVTSATVIGYSMGGRVALHLQKHFPELVDALVILSGAPGLKTESERQSRIKSDIQLIERLENEGFAKFVKSWYDLSIFGNISKNHDLMDQLLVQRAKNDIAQLAQSLIIYGNGALPSLWDHLIKVNCPILLMSGSDDTKYVNIHTEMLRSLPRGKHLTVDGCGHAFHLEKPLETVGAIRHFLSETIEGEKSDTN